LIPYAARSRFSRSPLTCGIGSHEFELTPVGDANIGTNGVFYVHYTCEAATPYESTTQRFARTRTAEPRDEL
jgi:hypothetical protein